MITSITAITKTPKTSITESAILLKPVSVYT